MCYPVVTVTGSGRAARRRRARIETCTASRLAPMASRDARRAGAARGLKLHARIRHARRTRDARRAGAARGLKQHQQRGERREHLRRAARRRRARIETCDCIWQCFDMHRRAARRRRARIETRSKADLTPYALDARRAGAARGLKHHHHRRQYRHAGDARRAGAARGLKQHLSRMARSSATDARRASAARGLKPSDYAAGTNATVDARRASAARGLKQRLCARTRAETGRRAARKRRARIETR